MAFTTIAVLGLGKVGHLAAELLTNAGFAVTGFDARPIPDAPFSVRQADFADAAADRTALGGQEAVLSCLPDAFNKAVASAGHALGAHYFDLTEDVATTRHIGALAASAKGVMAPQCGLAPEGDRLETAKLQSHLGGLPGRIGDVFDVVGGRLVNCLDPIGVDMRGVPPEVWRGARGIVPRKIMARQRTGRLGGAVAAIFRPQGLRFVFGMVENVDAPRKERACVVDRLRLDEHVGARFLRIGDDLQRRNLDDVLPLRALPPRHGNRKQVGKPEHQPRLVGDQPVLEQAEKLPLRLQAVDVVKIFERRFRAPAEEERRKRVRRRPLQDVRDIQPEVFLFDARLHRVDPGDDEAVEFLGMDVAEGAVELENVIGRRVPRLPPQFDAAHITVGGHEAQVDLQRRVAEPKRQLPLGRDLVRHQVDDGDFERPDVLMFGALPFDRQRAAERWQKRMDFLAVDDDGHCEGSIRRRLSGTDGVETQSSIRWSVPRTPFALPRRRKGVLGRRQPLCVRPWAVKCFGSPANRLSFIRRAARSGTRPPSGATMTDALNATPQQKSEILMQALPHMLRYDDAIVVVKYGGHAMGDEQKARDFAKDMVLLEQSGINPVVVHGGGPQIGSMLKKLGIELQFSGGLRVTDKPTIEIVEMVLAGSINKQIVGSINAEGGRAVGLCGKDGNMVIARKVHRAHSAGPDEDVVDLGFVGEPDKVDMTVLEQILGRDLIPVLAPVAQGADGQTYNVNADTFAGAIAGALGAKRLLFLTDVPGVLDKESNLIKELTIDDIRSLIADGTITGGMIPKVETCIYAIEKGVEGVVILDGKIPHAVLIELLTDYGAGTLITR